MIRFECSASETTCEIPDQRAFITLVITNVGKSCTVLQPFARQYTTVLEDKFEQWDCVRMYFSAWLRHGRPHEPHLQPGEVKDIQFARTMNPQKP
jgi:hypothetical protein